MRAADPFDVLRRETAEIHAAVEAVSPFLRNDLTLAGYRDGLIGLLAVHLGVEPAAEPWLNRAETGFGFDLLRPRTPDLLADLAVLDALGATSGDVEAAWDAEFGSVAEAVGARYVIEGAALGGIVVDEHVRERLGAAVPRIYLRGAGDGTAARWLAFRRTARPLLAAPGAVDAAVGAALDVFGAFQRAHSVSVEQARG